MSAQPFRPSHFPRAKPWRIGTEVYGDRDILPRDVISRNLTKKIRR